MLSQLSWRSKIAVLLLVSAVSIQACSSDSNTTTPGSIALSVAPASATVQQGGSTIATGTLARTNFTGAVAVTVEGAPNGVTASVALAGNSATVTLNVASSPPTGTYPLTVRAKGTGVTDATATFTLTVAAPTAGSYTVTLNPAALNVAQGAIGSSTLTLARTSFTGNVTFSVDNLPSGITGTFSPNPAPAGTSTLTLNVGSTTATGLLNLVVRGTSAGMTDVTAPLALTVTAGAGFSIVATPAALSVAQGGTNITGGVKAARVGGFSGALTYSLTGAPTGVTATFATTAITDSMQVSIAATSGVATGTYSALLHAISGTIDQTTPITITVTAGSTGGGGLRLDYSACATGAKPIFVAYQDGTGAWTRATGTGDVYSFNIGSSKGGVAVVTQSGSTFSTSVTYLAQSEFGAFVGSCSTTGSKTITGTVAGLATGDFATFGLDGGSGSVAAPLTALSINNVAATGTFDLLGTKRNLATTGNERVFLRRDVNVATTTTLGTLDFTGSESFAPMSVVLSIANVPAGETASPQVSYYTGASCSGNSVFTGVATSAGTNAFNVFGVPTAQQRASDYHLIGAVASSSSITGSATQSILTSSHLLTARTLTLPAALTGVTVTSVGSGPYKRLQTSITLPTDFSAGSLSYFDAAGNIFITTATAGYLGGSTSLSLTAPDLSAASGFLASWEPATGATVTWSVSASSSNVTTAGFCTEGAQVKGSSVGGTN